MRRSVGVVGNTGVADDHQRHKAIQRSLGELVHRGLRRFACSALSGRRCLLIEAGSGLFDDGVGHGLVAQGAHFDRKLADTLAFFRDRD